MRRQVGEESTRRETTLQVGQFATLRDTRRRHFNTKGPNRAPFALLDQVCLWPKPVARNRPLRAGAIPKVSNERTGKDKRRVDGN